MKACWTQSHSIPGGNDTEGRAVAPERTFKGNSARSTRHTQIWTGSKQSQPRSRRRAVSTSCDICPHFRFSFMPCCPMIYSSSQTILTGKPGGEWQRKERRKALHPHLFLSLSCGWHSVNYQVQKMLPPTCSRCLASFTLMFQLYNGIHFKTTNDTDDGGHRAIKNQKKMKRHYFDLLRLFCKTHFRRMTCFLY